MRKSLLTIVTALALPLVAGLVSSASAARGIGSSGPSSATFTDPAGDASGGPDISKVEINGDAGTGMITFAATVAGYPTVSPDGLTRVVSVWLNTDNNDSTGSPNGNEYTLQAYNDPADPDHWWSIGRWGGSAWQAATYAPTMRFSRSGDVLTWTVSKADLGGATGFAVYVTTFTQDASGNSIFRDSAPDTGQLVYDISGPTRSVTQFLTPKVGTPVTVPAHAIAGKRFTVSFPVTRTDGAEPKPLTGGTMVGKPSVAGKVIRHAESFKTGVAKLSFVVPKNAKGKQLKVKVTIKAPSYRGEDGTWLDITTGKFGIVGSSYIGQSTTTVVSFLIR